MCGSSGRLNAHDPCSNGPPLGVIITLNVSKVGSSMAMKKSRIQNLPIKDSHRGVNLCEHIAHGPAVHSRGEDCRGLQSAGRPCGRSTVNQRCTWAGGAEEDPETCRQAPERALIRAVKRAYLNLNLNFKIEGKNHFVFFSLSQKSFSKLTMIIFKLHQKSLMKQKMAHVYLTASCSLRPHGL